VAWLVFPGHFSKRRIKVRPDTNARWEIVKRGQIPALHNGKENIVKSKCYFPCRRRQGVAGDGN
jgi:hypothetical protein